MILEMIIAELISKSSKFRALPQSIGQEEPGCQIRDRGLCGGSGGGPVKRGEMVNMKKTAWRLLGAATLALSGSGLTGCQTWFAGMTLPSGHYLEHQPQYFPPSPFFPLSRELASQEAAAAAVAPGVAVLPAPAPAVPSPVPVVPAPAPVAPAPAPVAPAPVAPAPAPAPGVPPPGTERPPAGG
jgi:hypothetical protein